MQLTPRIAAIGLASIDLLVQVESYPSEGQITVLDSSGSVLGGTTAISAVTAARLGAEVSFTGCIGSDRCGADIVELLHNGGVNTSGVIEDQETPTDRSIVIISKMTGLRTIFRKRGARITKGDKVDIAALFSSDVCFVDVDDPALYRLIVDLPVHTNPNVKLLGSMTYLTGCPDVAGREILPRLDSVVGTSRDAQTLTGTSTTLEACSVLRDLMSGANLRFAAVTNGPNGSYGVTPTRILHVKPIGAAVNRSGAGEAFCGALAFAMSVRWEAAECLKLCSVVAGLSTTTLGSQSGLPTMAEVLEFLDQLAPEVSIVD